MLIWLLAAFAAHAKSGRPDGRRSGTPGPGGDTPRRLARRPVRRRLHRAEHHPAPRSRRGTRKQASSSEASIFGPTARVFWPASGILALVLAAGSVFLVARRRRSARPRASPCALGLACVFAAFGTLVLTIGWGRAGSGERAGFDPRYVTLVAPLGGALVFAWHLYATPALLRAGSVPACMFAALLVLLWPNTQMLDHARMLAGKSREFKLPACAKGCPCPAYQWFPFHPSQDELTTQTRRPVPGRHRRLRGALL